jgi:hypothetical protein
MTENALSDDDTAQQARRQFPQAAPDDVSPI